MAATPRRRRPPRIEEIEPRLLYAADMAALSPVAAAWAPAHTRLLNDGLATHPLNQALDQQLGALLAEMGSQPLPVLTPESTPRSTASPREVVFIDGALKDADDLAARWRQAATEQGRNLDVVLLDPRQDGVAQVSTWLAQAQPLQAIHLVSHGAAGQVRLGNAVLDANTLDARSAELQGWAAHLAAGADLMVYGCDVAASADGQALMARLRALTGADVAASLDRSGAAALGGNWGLESRLGDVQADWASAAPSIQGWQGTLATFTVTSNSDTNTVGTLRWAINQANSTTGADTITFSGVSNINLGALLPQITDQVSINGTSAGGTPGVTINAGAVTIGLDLVAGSDGSTVRGLVLQNFSSRGLFVEGAKNITIAGNYIGTDATGNFAAGNFVGIDLFNAGGSVVGGSAAADRNVISGNNNIGLNITGAGSTGIVVKGNYIGTTAAGTGDLGNTNHGIYVNAASGVTIGGSAAGEGNIISGQNFSGVTLDTGASGVTVLGNLIGLNAAGTGTIANSSHGIWILGANNTIGGTSTGARNVISGNGVLGIRLSGASATGNTILGNYIGTGANGTTDLGNAEDGIQLDTGASNNTIGGTATGARNIIAGNNNAGIALDDAATTGNIILGNWIGVGSNGTTLLANSHNGINVNSATGTLIGDGSVAGRNVVAGNTLHGVGVVNASGTAIRGNWLVNNGWDGVNVNGTSSGTVVGGTTGAEGNLIAYNGFRGILVTATPANAAAILANQIYANGDIGIDLANNGYDVNDALDPDSGPNGLQNYPVLASAASSTSGTTIVGSLNSNAGQTYRIDFYTNPQNNPEGSHGEGQRWLGSTTVTTDGSGNANFNTALSNVWVNHGDEVTATATRDLGGGNYGGSSEFALNISATASGVVVVDTTSDSYDAGVASGSVTITTLGTSRGGDGRISLREALFATNNTANGASPDRIVFAIPPNIESGNYNTASVVTRTIRLASLLPDVSQAVVIDASSDASFTANGNRPAIVLSGDTNNDGTADIQDGLRIWGATSGGSTVRGLVIQRFTQDAIDIASSNGNTVAGNWIGLDTAGTAAAGNQQGVNVWNSSGNTIGGTGALDGNVISGNSGPGIYIGTDNGSGGSNLIVGNRIGTNAAGTAAVGNLSQGILLSTAGNTVGGTSAAARNIVSGNANAGVYIINAAATGNVVIGNYIGTDASGTADINGSAQAGGTSGVVVDFGASNNRIGTNADGSNDAAERNIISGNNWYGLEFLGIGTTGNVAQGNYIGTDVTGQVALGNSGGGLSFWGGASGNRAGGGATGAGNVISGNLTGVLLAQGVSNNRVQGNLIGLAADGSTALGNTGAGVYFYNGGTGNAVTGNLIGTDGDGSNDAAERNVIAANVTGVALVNSEVSGNTVAGNYIGTDASGTLDRGNSSAGVLLQGGANGNTVGGSLAVQRNLISGNGQDGIRVVDEASDGNLLRGNWVGVNATGTATLGNDGDGIFINAGADNTVVGGSGAAEGNWVAGNGIVGIEVDGASTGTVIQGNRIGTDLAGTANWGQQQNGLLLEGGASNTLVGGTSAAAANTIAFNGQGGVWGAGISVAGTAGAGNSFLGNRVYGSVGLGIDLGSTGVNANDSGDADTGANNLQNFPVLASARTNASNQLILTGTLNSTANSFYRIEFFANTSQDGTGYGEGQTYLGFANVATDGSGNATISTTLGVNVAVGTYISATATKSDATYSSFTDTSEFGRNVYATATTNPALVVDTTADTLDGDATSISTLLANKGADGFISLREAITAANNTANTGTADVIRFNIASALVNGAHTITLLSDLPSLGEAVVIDGSSEPDFAGAPVVQLTDGGASTTVGLTLAGSGSTVRGLSITGFNGQGLLVSGNNNVVAGNWIGMAPNGSAPAQYNYHGIVINGSGNLVGGSSAADRNVIGYADYSGITLNGGGATNNRISGNYIGLLADGSTPATMWNYAFGLFNNANGNIIGTNGDGAGDAGEGNVIGGGWTSLGNGGLTTLTVAGNRFGLTAAGAVSAGGGGYLEVTNGTTVRIGTNGDGNSDALEANVFAGPLVITGAVSDLSIAGNFIGVAADGSTALGNGSAGVVVSGNAIGSIGGTSAALANAIAFNGGDGIEVTGSGASVRILRNAIYDNAGQGIDLGIVGVTSNDAGDTDTGANNLQNFPVLTTARTNASNQLILAGTLNSTANSFYRVEFFSNTSPDASGNGEGQTYLGFANVATDGSGNATISTSLGVNAAVGTYISATATKSDATYSSFTDTSEFGRNVYATATTNPALVVDTTADTLDGDATSISTLLANKGADGLISLREAITAANNTANTGTADVIQFNIAGALVNGAHTITLLSDLPWLTEALVIDGSSEPDYAVGAPRVVLDGNLVAGTGLSIQASNTTVRGLVLQRFAGRGIEVFNGAANVHIVGNHIGTDVTGLLAQGNGLWGIDVTGAGPGLLIGGNTAADSNVIGSNLGWGGIAINNTLGATVTGNYIGVGADGVTALGNGVGVLLLNTTTGARIGGTTAAERNVIAHNTGSGVAVWSGGSTAALLGNAIHDNAGQGIDLQWDGLTQANDAGDVDNLQNFPVLASAYTNASNQLMLTGTLNSSANSFYRIEFFASPSQDGSGHGEGSTYLGFANVASDGSGNASISTTLTANVAVGSFISATATKSDAAYTSFTDTSEFSANLAATAINTAPTGSDGSVSGTEDQPYTFSTANFGYSDTDGDALLQVWVDTLPGTGTLRLSGAALAAGSAVTASDINAGRLTYHPATDAAGASVASFSFRVQDSGGTLGGGADTDASANTLVINLAAVNDAPSFTNGAGSGRVVSSITAESDSAGATLVQPDGRIVVAGGYNSGGVGNAFLARYNNDGTLDPSFGSAGTLRLSLSPGHDGFSALVRQADGKLLAAGSAQNGSQYNFLVVRFNTDGSLDSSFGTGGAVQIDFAGSDDIARSIALQGDGKIVVGGEATLGAPRDFAVVRLNTDGSLDTSFSGDGRASASIAAGSDDQANALLLQADGRIVLAGITDSGGSLDAALVRFNTDGSLDAGFDGDGIRTLAIGTGYDQAVALAQQGDGRLLVAGDSMIAGTPDITLVRLNSDGSLDASFGSGGVVTTAVGASFDYAKAMALQADGRIVVVGEAFNGSNNDVAVLRFTSTGALDTSFSGDGKLTTAVGSATDSGAAVALQADGSIVVAGRADFASSDTALLRYTADGTADPHFGATATLGGTVAYTEGAAAVVLDTDVLVSDAELSTADNFNGATLSLARHGGANAQDALAFDGTNVTTSGANLLVGGVQVGTYNFTGGEMVVSFGANATQARVNTLMRNIVYWNTSDAPPASVQIDWAFSDGNTGAQGSGGALQATGSTTVSISAVNDAPVLSNGGSVGAGEDSGGNPFFGVATVADVDSTDFAGGVLSASVSAGGESTDQLTLLAIGGVSLAGADVRVSGVTVGTWSGGTGGTPLVVNFNANAQTAQVQAVYQSITFSTSSNAPATGLRTISVGLTDGDGGTSNTATGLVNLSSTSNDAPTFSNLNGTPTFTEGGAAVVLDADVSVFDAELAAANSFAGATLFVSRNGAASAQDVFGASGTLGALTEGGALVVGGTTVGAVLQNSAGLLALSFTADATPARLDQVMQQVTYANASDAPPASVQLRWIFNDGNSGAQGIGGSLAASGSTTVTIIATNDPPVIVPIAPDPTFIEGGPPQLIDATGTISDADSMDFDGGVLIVSISANGSPDDRLMLRNWGTGPGQVGVSGSNVTYEGTVIGTVSGGTNGNALFVSFNTSASATAVQEVYRSIQFDNLSDVPSTATRGIYVELSDGDGEAANPQIRLVNVQALNDAPVNTLPASFTVAEDTLTVLGGVSIADIDAAGSLVTSRLQVDAGALNITLAGATVISAGSNASADLSLRGTVADINATLASLSYTGAANAHGVAAATLTLTTDDGGNTGTGGALQDVRAASITITPVNDAPVLVQQPGGGTYNEGPFATYLDITTAISDVDSANFDGGQLTVTITNNGEASDRLVVLDGFGVTASGSDLRYDFGSGPVVVGSLAGGVGHANPLVITFNAQATPAAAQAVARQVAFMSASDTPSTLQRTLSTQVSDGDGGTSLLDTRVMNVGAVNDAPTVTSTVANLVYTEGDGAQAVDPGLVVADIDNATLAGATVSIHPLSYVAGQDLLGFVNQAGISGSWNAGSGTLTLTGSATVAQYEAALRSVTYSNGSDAPDTRARTVLFSVSDGSASSAAASRDILVSAVNDAPALLTTAGSLNYNENAPATAIDPGLNLSDVDSATLSSATVRISVAYVAGEDTLGFVNQNGISGSWNASTGVLTLSGNATVAQYQAALRSVTYVNGSEAPSIAVRTVAFQVNDGVANSNLATRQVQVVSIDDAPTTNDTSASGSEDASSIAITLTGSDVDGTVNRFRLGSLPANGLLYTDAALTTLAVINTDIPASGQALTLYFVPAANWSGSTSFSYAARDVVGMTDLSPATASLSVAAVNDAPVLAPSGGAPSFTENGAAVVLDAGLALTDVDSATLGTATVVISSNYANGQDTLAFVNQNGISGSWNAASGTLTLSGSATVAQYQDALRSVTYVNSSDAPNTATRTLSFQVSDGAASSAVATRQLAVVGVNDAPTTNGTAASGNEGSPSIAVTLTGSDLDGTVNRFQLLDLPANGLLYTDPGLSTLAAVNTDLAASGQALTLYFKPTALWNGSTSFSFVAIDDAGGADATPATATLTVLPVNDAPTLSPSVSALVYTENDSPRAVDAGLTLTDPDSPTLAGASVRISAGHVPGQDQLDFATSFATSVGISGSWNALTGTLSLSGTATLAQYQAVLRTVTYTNSSDAPSTAARTLQFSIDDGAGGSATATRALTVLAVNDSPAAVNASLAAVAEDTLSPAGATLTALFGPGFSDLDDGASLAGALVTFNPLQTAQGNWQYSTDGGAQWNNVGAINSPSALALDAASRLRFVPTADYNGSPDALQLRVLDNSYSGGFTVGSNRASVDASLVGGTSAVAATAVNLGTQVLAVNDAPRITSDGGGAAAVLVRDENGLAVTTVVAPDVDSASVTYSIAGGADAARFAIDAATGALSFLAAPDFEAPADADANNLYQVLVQADDGTLADTQAITVRVVSVNEAPSLLLPAGQALAEDQALAVPGVQVADVDANLAEVSLAVGRGSLSLDLAGGASVVAGANGSASLTLAGNGAQLNAALASLRYQGLLDTNGPDTLQVQVRDSGGLSASGSVALTVQAVNDAPQITLPATPSLPEDGTLAFGSGATRITLADVDAGSATLSLHLVASQGTLSLASTAGLVLGLGSGTNDAELRVSGTLADLQAALDGLSFQAAPDFNGSASLALTLDDGGASGAGGAQQATALLAINVTPVNDAPRISSDGGAAAAALVRNENARAVTTVVASDIDSATLRFSIAGGADAARFSIDASTGVLSFITAPDAEAPSDADGDNVYNVLVQASDGSLTATQTLDVTVVSVNEVPGFTLPAAATGQEDTPLALTGLAVADVDGNLDGLLLSVGRGTLTVDLSGGATLSAGSNGSASLALAGTQAQLNAALASLSYQGSQDANGADTLTLTALEAGGPGAVATLGLNLAAVNDAPTVSAGTSGLQVGTDEDSASAPISVRQLLADPALGVADVDSPSLGLALVRTAGNGTWQYRVDGGAWTDVPALTATRVLLLPDATDLRYQPDNLRGETAGIEFRPWDRSSGSPSASGRPQFGDPQSPALQSALASGSASLALDVAEVNDAPIAAGGPVALQEDLLHTLALVDFGFSDPDGNALQQVRFDTLPATGTLLLDGQALAAGQAVDAASIAAGRLQYSPAADANGDGLAEIFFRVQDDGGAARGGSDTAAGPGVLRLNVAAVNDAPRFVDDSAQVAWTWAENQSGSRSAAAQDIDSALLQYRIVGGADAGLFSMDASTGAISLLQPADFETPADANGDNVFELLVQVDDGQASTLQAIRVQLQNVNEAPVWAGPDTAVVQDNSTTTLTVQASDPDATPALSYSIVGGADAAQFNIDPRTGTLSFREPARYFAPRDANADNVYQVQVQVSDGALTAVRGVSVSIAALPPAAPADVPVDTDPATTPPVATEPAARPPVRLVLPAPVVLNSSSVTTAPPGTSAAAAADTTETPGDAAVRATRQVPTSASARSPAARLAGQGGLDSASPIEQAVADLLAASNIDTSAFDPMLMNTLVAGSGARGDAGSASPQDSASADNPFSRLRSGVVQAETAVAVLGAGFVWWSLRAAGLLATVLASAPVWRHLDPIPILGGDEREREDEDDLDDPDAEAARDEAASHELLEQVRRTTV
ncbi:hypothetical protein BurJ1DRAFT_3700 [Burkholderiales bacterium JOSHI_001]|nr:hypothetical protein BurJ1DRAFT_3700 [Burkholderiales bacterium JOSHI_001]